MENYFKHYCIFTQSVGDLGGSQLYTLRRMKHLISKGCKVYIVTGSNSNFILQKNFEGIEILTVPEINYLPLFFFEGRIKKVEQKILDFLDIKNIDIIESHSLATSVYAEKLAKKINSKHIVYLLNEDVVKKSDGKGYSDFFEFKLKRRELFGVSSQSLRLILSREVDENENRFINIPFDKSEVENCDCVLKKINFKFHDYDLKIFTISRLDKSYIKNLISDVKQLSEKYPSKKNYLMIIGDSSDKNLINVLKKISTNTTNLKVEFTGYIHPVPPEIYKQMDLFIGMGTASVNSISQGCATAVIDPRDNKSPGFLGIDTNNFAYPENNGQKISILQLLDKVIKDKNILSIAAEKGQELFDKNYESNIVMKFFDSEIIASEKQKVYWDFKFKRSFRRKIEFIFINLFGIEKFEKLFTIIVKLKL